MVLLTAAIPGMLRSFGETVTEFRVSQSSYTDRPNATTGATAAEFSNQPTVNVFGDKLQATAVIRGSALNNPGDSYTYFYSLFTGAPADSNFSFAHKFTELELTQFKDLFMILVWSMEMKQ